MTFLDPKHFVTPRDSGLPLGYFRPDPDKGLFIAAGFIAVVLLVLWVWL